MVDAGGCNPLSGTAGVDCRLVATRPNRARSFRNGRRLKSLVDGAARSEKLGDQFTRFVPAKHNPIFPYAKTGKPGEFTRQRADVALFAGAQIIQRAPNVSFNAGMQAFQCGDDLIRELHSETLFAS